MALPPRRQRRTQYYHMVPDFITSNFIGVMCCFKGSNEFCHIGVGPGNKQQHGRIQSLLRDRQPELHEHRFGWQQYQRNHCQSRRWMDLLLRRDNAWSRWN